MMGADEPRSPMVLDAMQVRRWIAGFEAIAEADRAAMRRRGPDPAWAIALALSMIEAAERAGGPIADHPSREAEDAPVREVWGRLRARLRR